MLKNRIPVQISRVPEVTNVNAPRRAVTPTPYADGDHDHSRIYYNFCIVK